MTIRARSRQVARRPSRTAIGGRTWHCKSAVTDRRFGLDRCPVPGPSMHAGTSGRAPGTGMRTRDGRQRGCRGGERCIDVAGARASAGSPLPSWPVRRRAVEPLAGGLTNRNFKVTTPASRCTSARCRRAPTRHLLAIDRDAEHRELRWRRRTGVAPGGRGLPARPARRAADRVGRRPDARWPSRPARRRDPARVAAAPAGSCTPGRGSPATSTCSRCSGATWTSCSERGFRLPPRYLDFDAGGASGSRRALDARAGPTVPVPQRPAGREHHRRRRPALADRLRVLRQQRPLLRARQLWSESSLPPEQLTGWSTALLRPARPRHWWPGPGCSG